MKIEREMFKNFKGLKKLKKIKKEGCCHSFTCSECPLDNDNLNDNIECIDIICLDSYRKNSSESVKRMNTLIEIFTEEKINSILSKIAPNRNLKHNDYVVYDNKTFKIKGVLNKTKISLGVSNPILLSGYDRGFSPEYKLCIVDKETIEKEYTLWVEPTEIFALNDTVIMENDGTNVEYKIVAIDESDYPILLNDHNDSFFTISEVEESEVEKCILCSIPEAYEENYSEWVSSCNIKHK